MNSNRAIFTSFMSYNDSINYDASAEFTTDQLLRITPPDICRWLNFRAYGDPAPSKDMKPVCARSTTLAFLKKALSAFMPRQAIPWDPITTQGNPTRSDVVNKIIKDVQRFEVRREGVKSSARRAIEFDEFVSALTLVRTTRDKMTTSYMVASVLALQWHLIARIDDMMKLRFSDFTPNIQHRGTLICQMRWSKNILEERDAPEQIVLGSMDPRLCPLLSLAVYIESSPRASSSEFLFGNPTDGDRIVRRHLQDAFENPAFKKLKDGNMGTHSLRKGSTTYATRSGLSKDYVNRRGRWRTKKSMVDTYIDTTQPYPDACTAAVLTGPLGPCQYVAKHRLTCVSHDFLVSVAPTTYRVMGAAIAETLALALLWASLEPNENYQFELLPFELRERVRTAYASVGGNCTANAVERESFHVVGDGAELQLVAIADEENAIAEVHSASASGGPEYTRRQFAALHSQLSSLKRYVGDVMNEVLRSKHETQGELQKFNVVLKRMAMRPTFNRATSAANHDQYLTTVLTTDTRTGRLTVRLTKRPKDLFHVWHEYEFGYGGQKPAREFTATERGANKFAYSRRKVFWDVVAALVRAGFTSDAAIDEVYKAYGRNLSVSAILCKLREDRARGGHPSLRVGNSRRTPSTNTTI